MVRFRLGQIPVQVHLSHLLISGLFGYYWFESGRYDPERWPGRVLQGASETQVDHVLGIGVAIWVGIIFISVLVHELGHAAVARRFGYRPTVDLIGLGGFTRPNAGGPIPWWRDVLITAAGPSTGFALGAVAYAVARQLPAEGMWTYILDNTFYANAFWTAANLMPVAPLDGGGIARAVLMRIFGPRGFLYTQVLAVVAGAALALLSYKWGQTFLALMFGFYAARAVPILLAALKGQQPIQPTDPRALSLAQAAALYRDGRLDDARLLAERALEAEVTPTIRSHLHHLLGWISLKGGEGRAALDHFAQVQGRRVEPAALAAGFSLVGDDPRALALWQKAYEETKDPTVLHEWAGALLRLGRVEDAKRLPELDLAAAYACAERAAFIRKDFELAARMGESALDLQASSERAYDTACAYARAGKADDAVRLLQRAFELGFQDAGYAETDADLAALSAHPGFRAWLDMLRHGSPVTKP